MRYGEKAIIINMNGHHCSLQTVQVKRTIPFDGIRVLSNIL